MDNPTTQDPPCDSTGSQQPTATGDAPVRIPLKGGLSKIAGVQQSAADAQAERERFKQNEEAAGGGSGTANKIPLKGGPNKIIGVMQSAAGAQAEREKFAQSQADAGGADGDEDDGDAPVPVRIKGGPNKISSLKLTPEEARKQREEFDREQREKFGQGGTAQEDDEDQPAGVKPRGGPSKIGGIVKSAKDAQAERDRAAGGGQGEA